MTVPDGATYVGAVGGERLAQPGPADLAEQRVVGHLGVDLGAGVGHAAEGAVPGVVAGRVVQQHDAAGADVLAVDGHVGGERGGVRRDALRRRHLLAEDLRAQPRGAHLLDGGPELLGETQRRPHEAPDVRPWPHTRPDPPRSRHARHAALDLGGSRGDHPAAVTDPPVHDSAVPARGPGRAGPAHPGLVHAAGRSLAAGVPQAPRGRRDARVVHARPTWSSRSPCSRSRRYGVDAAIFFSDIVLPLKAVGVDLDIVPGVGPVVASPVETLADVAAIPDLDPGHVPFVTESVRDAGRRARRDAADRLRRRAVHGRVVPRRGRAVQGARQDQGDDVRRPRRVGRADAQDRRRSPRPTSRSRSRPAPPRCSSSTRGPGAMSPEDYRRYVMPYSAAVLDRGRRARRAADPLRRRHR